tara:strand:+ start:36 stop:1241 length:1206 start_codon:yes stop_codon:yes gene_type:complete
MIVLQLKVHLCSPNAMSKQRFLILSPINQYGGVNLDVGFIGSLLEQKNQVRVVSLARYFSDASVFYFNEALNYTSLDKLVYETSFSIRFLTSVVGRLKPLEASNHHRVDNGLTRLPIVSLAKQRQRVLEKEIASCDRLILCSQLTSNYMKAAIEVAHRLQIPVYFRTTGQIKEHELTPENAQWLSKVNTFIHHSEKNLNTIAHFLPEATHFLVDQNAYDEDRFLELPLLQTEVKRFYAISRLSPLKRTGQIIQAFQELQHPESELHIYGDGEEETLLKEQAKDSTNIHFHGAIDFADIHKAHGANDCLIIASTIEAGPYTGVEAMAGGRLIISSSVGAMETRLPDYPFFYDGTVNDLKEKMKLILAQETSENHRLSSQLRKRYTENYSEVAIGKFYLDILL